MSEENRDYEQPEQKDAPETNGWNGASDGDYSYKQEDPAQRRETPEQNSWQSGRSEWNFNSYDDFEKKDGAQSSQESFGANGSSTGASDGAGGYYGDWPPKKPKKKSCIPLQTFSPGIKVTARIKSDAAKRSREIICL